MGRTINLQGGWSGGAGRSRGRGVSRPVSGLVVFGLALGLVGCAWADPTAAGQRAALPTVAERSALEGTQAPAGAAGAGSRGRQADLPPYAAIFLEARMALDSGQGPSVLPRLQALVQKDDCPPEIFVTIAEIHTAAEDYAKAAGIVELGLKRYPQSADLHLQDARLLRQLSKLDEAITAAEDVLKIESHRQEALELLSEIHLQRLRQVTSEDQLSVHVKALISVYERMLEARQGTDRLAPLLILTSLYQRTGNPTRALELAQSATELAPREVRTHQALGSTLEEQGRTTEALQAYRQGLLLEPANTDIRQRVDALLNASGGADARVDFYEELARDFPSIKELQDQAGRLLVEAGRWEQADVRLQHVVQTWPDDAHARVALVRVWLALGKNEEAVRECEKLAAEKNDLAPLVALSVGESLINAGQADRALGLVRGLQQRQPGDEMLTLGLASLLQQSSRAPEAIDLLQAYLKEHADSFKAASTLVDLLSDARHFGEAYQVLDGLPASLRSQNGDEIDALRAQVLQTEKRLPEAFTIVEGLLKKYPSNAQFQISAGYLNQLMGKNVEAEKCYREALRLSPTDAEVFNTLGYFLAQTNQKLEEAHTLVAKALEMEPEAAHIMDSMGWVLYQQGDFTGALGYLERASRLMKPAPDAAEVWDHLAETYLKLNRPQDARTAWKRALELNPQDETIRGKLGSQLNAAK